MTRGVIHVDMDAFYASVEQRDHTELRGRPVIVGGHPKRGVVLAASYEVRPFGVRSAMPMARAVQLAPAALVVPPRFEAYAEASERVFAIFERYTPLIEPLSLDEAFLDVTGSIKLFGAPAEIARRIRQEIKDELDLPASAGVAEVKFVAKIASDLAKPNGQLEVAPGTGRVFLAPLPVSRLWGVGPKTEQVFLRHGLRTIGDVAEKDLAWLEQRLGDSAGHYYDLARAVDPRVVVPDREAKSIGAEDTFESDESDRDVLLAHVHAQAWRVARRLRRARLLARVVVLKLKTASFRLLTRRRTLPEPTDDAAVLYKVAAELLAREKLRERVRLTGVSAQDLRGEEAQLSLLDPGGNRARRLNATLDAIAQRFGSTAVLPADVHQLGAGGDDEARRQVGAARFDDPLHRNKPR